MMAGIFIAVGVITLCISFLTLFSLKSFGSPNLAMTVSVWALLAFFLLFILGVVGLSLNGNGQFVDESRNNMYQTARQYDEMATHKHQTRKMNWVQTRFECCAIESYGDWKSLSMFGGSGYPNRLGDQLYNNNYNNYINNNLNNR